MELISSPPRSSQLAYLNSAKPEQEVEMNFPVSALCCTFMGAMTEEVKMKGSTAPAACARVTRS